MGAIYGVTLSGFVAKRLADIKTETTVKFQEKFGTAINLDPRGPMGIIKNILDEEVSKVWELAEEVYNSQYPDTSEGNTLDNVASITGTVRKEATKSQIDTGVARGDFGTVIPAGTVFSVLGNSTARFTTDEDVTINIAAVNEVQKITFSAVPDEGAFQFLFDNEQTVSIPFSAVALDVQNALNGLVALADVTVSGNFTIGFTVTFAGADGGQDQPLLAVFNNTLEASNVAVTTTVTTLTPGDRPKATGIKLTAENAGAVQAPAGSLTVIETAVSGLESFTNEEDAEVGEERETDAELKTRRANELGLSGAATIDSIRSRLLQILDVEAVVVFQNKTNLTDVDGRPPHSLDIVVQGGDEDEVAQRVFEVVAGGIETIGAITKTVTDSQGFSQTVKFSRPTEKNVWVEFDITRDVNKFPLNGSDLIKAAVLAYGETLGMGDDVIVYPALIAQLNSIPGIIDVVTRIGLASNPTLDDNIVIAAREIALFDTARIEVNLL